MTIQYAFLLHGNIRLIIAIRYRFARID